VDPSAVSAVVAVVGRPADSISQGINTMIMMLMMMMNWDV